MLQLPLSHFNIDEKKTKNSQKKEHFSTSEILDLRQQLLAKLEQFSQENNNSQPLITQIPIDKIQGDESWKADCVIVDAFLKESQKKERLSRQFGELEKERQLIISVAKKSASVSLLTDYLKKQLTVYTKHLMALGLGEQEIKEQGDALRQYAIEQTLLETLKSENVALACEILTHYLAQFTQDFVQACIMKLNWLFAKQQAEALWAQAFQKFPHSYQEAMRWIENQPQKSDPLLEEYRTLILQGLQASYLAQEKLNHVELLERLINSSATQALEALLKQHFLEPFLLRHYQQAGALLEQSVVKPDAALFVKFYFSSDEAEIWKAYEQRHFSARDYFILRREQVLRANGKNNLPAQWYCKQLEVQLRAKGFSAAQISHFQYELLTAADLEAAWKELENLLKK